MHIILGEMVKRLGAVNCPSTQSAECLGRIKPVRKNRCLNLARKSLLKKFSDQKYCIVAHEETHKMKISSKPSMLKNFPKTLISHWDSVVSPFPQKSKVWNHDLLALFKTKNKFVLSTMFGKLDWLRNESLLMGPPIQQNKLMFPHAL